MGVGTRLITSHGAGRGGTMEIIARWPTRRPVGRDQSCTLPGRFAGLNQRPVNGKPLRRVHIQVQTAFSQVHTSPQALSTMRLEL
jgi:hypothetical protein